MIQRIADKMLKQRITSSRQSVLLLLTVGNIVNFSAAFVTPPSFDTTSVIRGFKEHPASCLRISKSNSFNSNSGSSSSRSNSWVEFTDPETGCDVVLLGCLHGSKSSSADVETLFPGTDVLVLELCESRFTELRKSVLKETIMSTDPSSRNKNNYNNNDMAQVEWSDYVRMVSVMSERGGWSTGLAAAVLGGMSGWQTALTGMTPGLEFRTGLKLALASSSSSDAATTAPPCDVILADQDVSETLRRIGQLPQVSWSLLQEWIQSGSWQDTMAPEARSLHTAVWGNDRLRPFQLRTMDVLRRNRAVILDILRVSAPSLIMGYLTLTLISQAFPSAEDMALMGGDVSNDHAMIAEALANIVLLITGYIGVLLPATRVVLTERDDQLYKGIQAACRVAATKQQQASGSNGRRGRVLAVVGLLHVNGIAERLLSDRLLEETTL